MSTFSIFSTSYSYCHDIGQSAVEALKTLKSAFFPDQFYSSSSHSAAAAGISLLAATNQQHYCERLGWVIQTRLHFGNHLSSYIGISIFVKNNVARLSSIARASGLVLLVGVGSYVAYRICLKLFGCRDFTSLLHYLYGERSDKANDQSRLNRCVICKKNRLIKNEDDTCSGCYKLRKKDYRRRLYSKTNEDEIYESSNDSSECETSDELEDNNGTETTDLESEWSEEYAKAARIDARMNMEMENGQVTTANEFHKKRWRNSVGKRTNALDDPHGDYGIDEDSEDGSDGFSKSRSPPPIPRFRTRNGSKDRLMSQSMPAPVLTPATSSKAPSVKSMSAHSVPSSQQFIWDPVCSPGDENVALNDELLAYFADVPTGELVQRFLDGLFLSNDHNRVVSPGLSEAASEFSLSADRQIGDGTAEHFERLQFDLTELRTDVDEFDAEFTTYMQERSDCLKSDSRVFYRSVIVDDETGTQADDEEATPSNSPPSTPEKTPEKDPMEVAASNSPCRQYSNKRQRKSHESSTSNASSPSAENGDTNGNTTVKKKRCRRSAENDGQSRSEQERAKKESTQERKSSSSFSANTRSVQSLDTGYMSSYHTMMSSMDSVPCSLSSPCSVDEVNGNVIAQRNDNIQGIERPSELKLPKLTYDTDSICQNQKVSDESGKASSSFLDSLPSSSYAITPADDRSPGSWRKRPQSAMSLEWEDEIFDEFDNVSPSSNARSRNSKGRLKAVDLIEFLRLYYNVDPLENVPKMYQFGRKLTKRGYRRVLLYNDTRLQYCADSATSSKQSHLDSLIRASLIGVAHSRWPIFKCHSFKIVPEAVDVSMKRCSFFAERCSTYFGSMTPEGTRAYILQCMQKLWQLHETVQQNELKTNLPRVTPPSPSPCWALIDGCMNELVDGMKVLMALRSLETYEEILFTRRTPCAFYTDLFRIYTPASYAEKKLFNLVDSSSISPSTANLDDLDIALLADTLAIRIEVFRPGSLHPQSVAVYPELEHNANLSRPRLPLLEPGSSCGLYMPLI